MNVWKPKGSFLSKKKKKKPIDICKWIKNAKQTLFKIFLIQFFAERFLTVFFIQWQSEKKIEYNEISLDPIRELIHWDGTSKSTWNNHTNNWAIIINSEGKDHSSSFQFDRMPQIVTKSLSNNNGLFSQANVDLGIQFTILCKKKR